MATEEYGTCAKSGHPLRRIVSGGQTGADRAALDVALALGIAAGGWAPKGRRAEDGSIAQCYPLAETPLRRYSQRTEWNVRDSDATLIVARRPLTGGTALTERLTRAWGRPCLVLNPNDNNGPATLRAWLEANAVAVLNVAGPREGETPDAYPATARLLRALLAGD